MSQNRGLRPLDPVFDPDKRLGAISVGNSQGSTAGMGLPRFSWPGVVDSLDESPPWVSEGAITWTECIVGLLNIDQIEFDIKVNGAVIESIVCSSGSPQTFEISVPVVRDDQITIELTAFDDGLAEDVSVCLRLGLPPPFFATDGLIHLIAIGNVETSAGAGGPYTVSAPAARAVGNVLVLQRHHPNTSGSFTVPTGWNRISIATGATNGELMETFWRVADGTSADDATVGSDGTVVNIGRITAWSNVDAANPVIGFPATVYTSNTDPFVAPSITNAMRQNVVLRMYGGDDSPTHALNAGGSLYTDVGGGFIAAGYDRPGSGASGTGTDDLSGAEVGAAMSISLRPFLASAPSIRVGAGATSGTSSTITPAYPSDCASGDIAFLAITTAETGTQADPTVPAGWTRIQFQTYNYTPSSVHRSTALYKKDAALTGSEDSTTISVTGPSDHRHSAVIFTARGATSISTAAGGVNTADNGNCTYAGPTRVGNTDATMVIVVGAQLSTVGTVKVSDDSTTANLVLAQNASSSGLFSQTSVQAFPLDSTDPGTILYTVGAGCTDVRSIAVICSS